MSSKEYWEEFFNSDAELTDDVLALAGSWHT